MHTHRLAPLALFTLVLLAACEAPPAGATPDGDAGACAPGTLGCECGDDERCGLGRTGDPLICDRDLCVPARCAPGETGCVCRAGAECDASGDACDEGVCRPAGCVPGDAGCACADGVCGSELACDRTLGGSGTCVDHTGFPGGPCPESGLCRDRSRCDRALRMCVSCAAGSDGCEPDEGRCNEGLVLAAGRCVPPVPPPPEHPVCHTRCRADLVTESGIRDCDAEGLMDGCIGDRECVEGTCVLPGESRPPCASDLECPDFQACIAGHCYSNCESDTECPDGRVCDHRVCRIPCNRPDGERDMCPTGTYCALDGSLGGVCRVLVADAADPDAEPRTDVRATFAPDVEIVSLSRVDRSAFVRVSTDSPLREIFTVRAVAHRAYDESGAAIDEADAMSEGRPLSWVRLRVGSVEDVDGSVQLAVDPACGDACPAFEIVSPESMPDARWARWEGTLEISHPELGVRYVSVEHVPRIDGRWVGSMFYFANFGTDRLEEWRASPRRDDADYVGNALVQRWGAYRRGALDGFAELDAVLTATRSGSWDFPNVRTDCTVSASGGACYLYDDGSISSGIRTYVTSLRSAPVPTGVMELPIAIHLRAGADTRRFTGRIDSAVALHYPGNPALELAFGADPSDPARCEGSRIGGECVTFVTSLSSDSVVGGRYVPSETDTSCATGYRMLEMPWLVPGLGDGVRTESSGLRARRECRDPRMPFSGAGAELNVLLSGANPVRDGAVRRRSLRVLDGVLIEDDVLFVMFEERFQSHLDSADLGTFAAYGYMTLRREPAVLAGADFLGSTPPTTVPTPRDVAPRCDPALLREVLDPGERVELTRLNADRVVARLVDGVRPGSVPYPSNRVHYYCEDTGLFDGGPQHRGTIDDVPVACPPGSNVVWFAFPTGWMTQAEVADLPCQDFYDGSTDSRGRCGETLREWQAAGLDTVDFAPVWSCADGAPFCDGDRSDLRIGKRFHAATGALFPSLAAAVAEAFRYRIRFRTDTGRTLGFTPEICDPVSDSTPYCYDPGEIDELRGRMDCLMEVYRRFPEITSARPHLSTALSYASVPDPLGSAPRIEDGFERLYAELLVMLGDESYTSAFRSRFDLAATRATTFEGARFEAGGMNLTGVAGWEMHSLYQAQQYYDLSIERFFAITPVIWEALRRRDVGVSAPSVVTPGLVTWYLDRVVRASTQKARTYAAIAQRYQGFHRTDLARAVLQRGYLAAYLESVLLTRMMQHVVQSAAPTERDQVTRAAAEAELRWRVALREMREVHASLTDDATYFGFPVDFVPIPVRDDGDFRASNIFEDAYRIADEILVTARRHEEEAMTAARSFDTDAASFQVELRRLSQSYEERLGPLCGFFTGRDGRSYPAIERYAHLDTTATSLGDPCGRMGNGQIHREILELQQSLVQRQLLMARIEHARAAIADETARVDAQCGLAQGTADFEFQQGSRVLSLQDEIRTLNLATSMLDRASQITGQLVGFIPCSKETCVGSAVAATIYSAAAIPTAVTIGVLTQGVNETEHDIEETNLETARWRTLRQCDAARIDSTPVVAARLREIQELRLEAQQQTLAQRIAQSEVEQAVLSARRIQDEQREAEQLQIALGAAQTDPNVRVYRTDAILTAERSFQIALRYAYRATRVYEYYTSQSYPALEELFLVRMVTRGDYNLETYLLELRDDFYAFEETYRAPALRVERVSLRDHILAIPHQDESGRALTEIERIALMRERLRDPRLIDPLGHLTIPFRTRAEDLSPCTFNHKLQYVEVSMIGGDLGDDEADVLLWQEGTGIVQTLDEGAHYYRFPPGVVVINPYFGRNQIFDAAVYRRYELRDRPFLNTAWSLVLDQRDTLDNQDIDLEQLDDIVLYAYYNDFTDPRSCRRR